MTNFLNFIGISPGIDCWRAVIEILILFLMIYGVLSYLRSAIGAVILTCIFFCWAGAGMLCRYFALPVTEYIFNIIGDSMVVILLIIFQPELRRALAQLGSYRFGVGKMRREVIDSVVQAAEDMSRRRCGALIVLERNIQLHSLINDAVPLDSRLTALMLESIFYPNSPLHDGAVIVRNDRIVAARVILPLTQAENVSRRIGTRHRAAIGISEECDAVTVIVSEETGAIALTYRGNLYRDLSAQALENLLHAVMIKKDDGEVEETLRMLEEKSETERLQ
ncbi:MAG: diadenylate cyclase CdaA [Victivallaceae bacterium]|nr:diadenylate cyclase CdaA [Victivallaceae bacterium]